MQLQQEEVVAQATTVALQTYLQNEAGRQRERTKEAEELMAAGNSALERGEPQMARRAFQAAYGLSTHDAAFNEDARVQLHNIKLQEALVGLNVRQAAAAGDTAALGGKFRDLRGRKEVSYTQQDAKDIIDRNTADDNAAYMRLAERIVQQQDAAVSSPAAIRASIPEQGRVLTFQRAVVVETPADLRIRLALAAAKAAPWGVRILILALSLLILAGFTWRPPPPKPPPGVCACSSSPAACSSWPHSPGRRARSVPRKRSRRRQSAPIFRVESCTQFPNPPAEAISANCRSRLRCYSISRGGRSRCSIPGSRAAR